MVSGKLKSRRMRRIAKRTPGGTNTVHYVRRKPAHPVCGGCGSPLQGVLRMTSTQARATSRTKKRPERPYGGVLCSACSRQAIINRIGEETTRAAMIQEREEGGLE